MKMTSEQILMIVNAIGQATADMIEEVGIGEYVEGFAIMVNQDKLRELVRDELLAEAGEELTAEAEAYLDNLT